MSGIFKAYDVRGLYQTELDEAAAYKSGYFLPKLLNSKSVLIGQDARKSSPSLFQSLRAGVLDAGADVLDLGLSTTPYVYFATNHFKVDASVQITASHNPKQYNGFKISTTNALPVGIDTGLADLEKMVETQEVVKAEKQGECKKVDAKADYLKFLSGFMTDFSKLNVAFDASNGMSALFLKDMFKGANFNFLNCEIDGSFPAHSPNPLEAEAREQLSSFVVKNNCDFGAIFDGDADRVAFVDEKGQFIQPDYIISLIGKYYQQKGVTGHVICDVRTSKSTLSLIDGLGFQSELWKVGHAFAKRKLREKNAVYGGELAGHYYFRDFGFCDSALVACLVVMNILAELKEKGIKLSDFMKTIVKYHNSGEVNFKCERKDEAIKAISEKYASGANQKFDFDGIRYDMGSWWFSVRQSNTEPLLRLIVEADNKEDFDKNFADLKEAIQKFC